MSELSAELIAQAFHAACLAELNALKPGNVSVYSEGHGMRVSDFLHSADCVAGVMAQTDLGVGERILRSIQATQQAVGCNTNLGIVLLCAPLAQAAYDTLKNSKRSLWQALQQVLHSLDQTDAEQVFRAIRLAAPGGLGASDQHDVSQPAQTNLRAIMQAAEQRDRIAYQYSHDFADITAIGLPVLQHEFERQASLAWASVGVYLNFLASFPDSHIMRKQGVEIAMQVCQDAESLLALYNKQSDTQTLTEPLLVFDQQLKTQGINPGTSADLTVATLFAAQLQELLDNRFIAGPLRAAFEAREHDRVENGMQSLAY